MPPQASTSSSSARAAPSASLKATKLAVLTEHFRFAPETFAKGGMDLANRTMYAATQLVEQSLQVLVDKGEEGFEADEVQRGIYRLETLLEDAIDTQFDLFEIFVLRNTFMFPDDLLPYVQLPHQTGLDPSLSGADDPALSEYEQELALYEAELEKERQLAAAELFLKAKEAKAREQGELVGYLRQPGRLDPSSPAQPDARIPILAAQLSSLIAHLRTLHTTPSPSALAALPAPSAPAAAGGAGEDEANPAWASSRAAFLNWAAAAKVALGRTAAAGVGGEGGGVAGREEDVTVGAVQAQQEAVGSSEEAKALLAAMGR
ncbi:hypothetical protein JCM8097_004788 [Rhodosporidiobolus ruineniae]